MGEVKYSVNGKYFKDYGVYISSSDGLFDALKRKKVNTYDWAEYHGSSLDLSSPKFEQREISLKGFVTGANWIDMKSNFDAIISEFQKAGTQRLLIEPFGLKPLPYEVCMIDDVNLNKTFKDGKMVGVFTLKLIEPNPIKKVLYLTGTSLNLAYNSPNETEIFYGNGLKETAKGNVSLSNKTLANRFVSGYAFEGRNYFIQGGIARTLSLLQGSPKPIQDGIFPLNTEFAISFYAKVISGNGRTLHTEFNGGIGATEFALTTEFKRYTTVMSTDSAYPIWYLWITDSFAVVDIKDIMIVKGNKPMDYMPAPEDEKYIIIAGNVDEITNLTTNADVLWEQL
ncbi:galactose-binding protein [Chryseobacterium manosquense]|uniref:Galactose-binding protein n=1 Tax=Chryseobacterium manosquense TaxID=2754694 RepID=A0A7H1DT75_9FLAO|nr:galactose-binding protein [Chryseobacterium manosquense]QNS40183.1 galactose-binding protein [Chryseobacterium manosquense]